VTGSLNAALAQWLIAKAYLPRHYQARQGQRLGRDGLVDLRLDDADRLWVGGCSTIVIQGSIQAGAML
jgi:predicted PhzF superfamily epimerase YddE/YHI9